MFWGSHQDARTADGFLLTAPFIDQLQSKMSLNFGILGQVLFSPRKAFESVKGKTTIMDGILLYLIFAVLASVISLVLGGTSVVSMVISLVIGIVIFLLVSFLAMKLSAAIGKGKESLDETIGFLGYTSVIDLIMGVIMALLMMAFVGSAINATTVSGALGAVATAATLALIIGIVALIWKLYVGGTAVSVANNVSLGAGIAAYFISWLIVSLVIGAIVAAVFVGMYMRSGAALF